MLMQRILDYIQLKGRANLLDLARYFKINESALEAILDIWIKKGRIKLYDSNQSLCDDFNNKKSCSDCNGCNPSMSKIYIWCH